MLVVESYLIMWDTDAHFLFCRGDSSYHCQPHELAIRDSTATGTRTAPVPFRTTSLPSTIVFSSQVFVSTACSMSHWTTPHRGTRVPARFLGAHLYAPTGGRVFLRIR